MPPEAAALVSEGIAAPLWRRLAAGVYDLLPVAALLFIGTVLAMTIAGVFVTTARIDLVLRQGLPHLLLQLWLAVVLIGYYAWSWHRGGQTIGMKAWGLYLQGPDGQRLGLWPAVARCLLSWLSLLLLGAGFWWAINDAHRRTWHDLMTRSYMVYKKKTK